MQKALSNHGRNQGWVAKAAHPKTMKEGLIMENKPTKETIFEQFGRNPLMLDVLQQLETSFNEESKNALGQFNNLKSASSFSEFDPPDTRINTLNAILSEISKSKDVLVLKGHFGSQAQLIDQITGYLFRIQNPSLDFDIISIPIQSYYNFLCGGLLDLYVQPWSFVSNNKYADRFEMISKIIYANDFRVASIDRSQMFIRVLVPGSQSDTNFRNYFKLEKQPLPTLYNGKSNCKKS